MSWTPCACGCVVFRLPIEARASDASPSAERAVAEEAVVLADQEMALHDPERVERDADDDEQRRAAEEAGNRPRERRLRPAHDEHRHEGDDEEPRRADERDLRHDVVEVLGGGASGPDAGDVAAVLLQVVGDVDRVELRRHPEEREEHDQHGVDGDVQPGGLGEHHGYVVEPARGRGEVLDDGGRDLDERLREDDRHDARVVYAQRHERLAHAERVAASDAPARRVDGDLPDALGEHDRAHDDEQEEHDQDAEAGDRRDLRDEVALVRGADGVGEARGDVDHDDERRAVADAERRDLVGEPHHEERRGRHADHGHQVEAEPGMRDQHPVGELGREHAGVGEDRRDAPRLDDAEDDRQVPCDLRELLAAVLALLLQLLKGRDDRREELDHDLRRDVRPDREEADGALAQGAARERLEPPEQRRVRLPDVVHDLLEHGPVHARGRDLRHEAAHEHESERHEYLLPQLRDPERVGKAFHHRHCFFSPICFTAEMSLECIVYQNHANLSRSLVIAFFLSVSRLS